MGKSPKVLLILTFSIIAFGILFYTSCTSYDYNIIHSELNVCKKMQVKTLDFFSTLETGSNKLSITAQHFKGFENSYTSPEYKYSIEYPSTWTLEKSIFENHEIVYLTKKQADIKIIIGITEGSICANMGCDYNAGYIYSAFGKSILTKGFDYKKGLLNFPIGTNVLFYGFELNMDQKNPAQLPYIKGKFSNEEEGIEVADILTTIKLN